MVPALKFTGKIPDLQKKKYRIIKAQKMASNAQPKRFVR
jgi:hypothetical protein